VSIALLLLPALVGTARAVAEVLEHTAKADTVWVAMAAGAGCWLAVFVCLPKPMWLYVFGHELTHALWAWAFGGRVARLRVTPQGGHVLIDRTNFLIALAPYFFPLYLIVVLAVFALGHWLWDWSGHWVWLHFLIGVAYAFHVTLTAWVVRLGQPDLRQNGIVFSTVVIVLGNLAVVLFGLPLVTRTGGLAETAERWWGFTFATYASSWHWLLRLWR
jgi:hypothetical protein